MLYDSLRGSQGLVGGRMDPYLDGTRVRSGAAKVKPKDVSFISSAPNPSRPDGPKVAGTLGPNRSIYRRQSAGPALA